jgi:hypothetical protein
VKAVTAKTVEQVPDKILGAAWGVQSERMSAGIYFPLFIVLVVPRAFAIYYLSADVQVPEMFRPRKPLSESARRAGWQGFIYDMRQIRPGSIVRLV